MKKALWFETALLPGGWAERVALTVVDGLIADIRTGAPPEPGAETLHGGVALPGLCNVHSHAFQRAMAGLAEARGPDGAGGDDDFWTWRAWMYRFLERLDPEDVEAVAAQAYAEMLEGGFTRVGEFHYLHHAPDGSPYTRPAETAERIAAAAATSGIGLTLLPVYYRQGGFGGADATPGQRRFLTTPDSFARLLEESAEALRGLPDSVLGIAPHSLRAVTPHDLAQVLAMRPTAPIHIHAAEQVKEVQDCLAWSGARPVQWLLDNAGVDARWCLIHATHLEAAETAGLAASEAVAGLCPITEANLGDGVFPAREYLDAGGRFGIGTDSNVQIGAADELRLMEYAQRLTRRARNVLADAERPATGAGLYRRALAGGAQALSGLAELAVGRSADIVVLDGGAPTLDGRRGDAILDSLVFAGRGWEVAQVWRRGVKVVDGGRHVQADAIAARYARTMKKLLV